MFEAIGISSQAFFGQLMIGLINGSFYALLSLGLAVIFGLLNVINFAHGAMYMMGAFVAWFLLTRLGLSYWWSLLAAPLVVGVFGMVMERIFLKRVYKMDHIYGLLLTLGLALVIEGVFRSQFGNVGQPYGIPALLTGRANLGFMSLPYYRAWVIGVSLAVCVATWLLIEKTKLGSYLRAANENAMLVRAFGVNVPRMITLTYGFGVGLAALGGVMAAPIYQVSPLMGGNIIITVFAVVVIGGMGSIVGAVASGFLLGIVEGLTKVFYPEASSTVVFVVMTIVLLVKPSGLFGKSGTAITAPTESAQKPSRRTTGQGTRIAGWVLLALAVIAPFAGLYQGFLMKAMCFALFACAYNLLIGYAGLLSFGHAAFFGLGAYVCGYAMKAAGITPEIGLLCGTVAGALAGLVFGWLAIRRQGIYFAMVTLALSQMLYFLCFQAPFTGGEDGLRNVPRGRFLGLIDLDVPLNLYFFVLAVFLLGFFIIYRTIHSPFGQVLKAIRENEPRAVSLGYKTQRCKLIAFVISAALAGLAGSTKTLVFEIASLTDVHWAMSGQVVLMTLLGGMGTILGPVIGAVILVAIDIYLAPLGSWVTVIQGCLFIACVMMFRSGVVGAMDGVGDRLKRLVGVRRPPPAALPTGETALKFERV